MRMLRSIVLAMFATSLYVMLLPATIRAAADQIEEFRQDQTKSRQQEEINQTRQREQLDQLQRNQQLDRAQQQLDQVKQQRPDLNQPQQQQQINQTQQQLDQIKNEQQLNRLKTELEINQIQREQNPSRQKEQLRQLQMACTSTSSSRASSAVETGREAPLGNHPLRRTSPVPHSCSLHVLHLA